MFDSGLYGAGRYAAGKTDYPAWPTEVFLEISNICDLKCAMCPTFSPLNPNRFKNLQAEYRGLMKLEAFDEHLREVLSHANVVHAFGYGEPTIHPNFRQLISQLGRSGVWVDFFTHGMHLSQELCDFLVEEGVGQVTVSFSGATREDYESVYLGGNFERVLEGLKRLEATKKAKGTNYPEIHINSIAFKHHVRELPVFVELMHGVGVSRINLKPLATYDPIPELHQHSSLLSSPEEKDALHAAERRAKELGVELKVSIAPAPDQGKKEAQERQHRHKGKSISDEVIPLMEIPQRAKQAQQKLIFQKGGAPLKERSREREILSPVHETMGLGHKQPSCNEPLSTLYIDLNGNARPCCFANGKHVALGQIREHSGAEIWRSDAFRLLQEQAEQRRYPKALCEMCIKASSYPRIPESRFLETLLMLFSSHPQNLLPWWFLVAFAATTWARLLPWPYRANFLNKVHKSLLWVGLARRRPKGYR